MADLDPGVSCESNSPPNAAGRTANVSRRSFIQTIGVSAADGSGMVNFSDITAVLGNWLSMCP